MVSVAPMKSKTVAPKRRTSSQKPDAENRSPMAAVVPSTSAGITVSTAGVEVEERERAVEDVVVRGARSARSSAAAWRTRVAVGEHAALRRPGRARGEQHHRRVGDHVARWRLAAAASTAASDASSVDGSTRRSVGVAHRRTDDDAQVRQLAATSARAGRAGVVSTTATSALGEVRAWTSAGPRSAVLSSVATAPSRHSANQVITNSGPLRHEHGNELARDRRRARPARRPARSTRRSVSAKVRSPSAKRRKTRRGVASAARSAQQRVDGRDRRVAAGGRPFIRRVYQFAAHGHAFEYATVLSDTELDARRPHHHAEPARSG